MMKKNWENYAKLFLFEKGEAIFFRGEEVKGLHILSKGIAVAEMLKENGDVNQIEEMKGETFLASAFIFGENPYYPVDLRRSEEHTSELQSRQYLVCRLLLEKKKIQHH